MTERTVSLHQPEEVDLLTEWPADRDQRCIVCGRKANGMAICEDPACAEALAQG